MVAIRRWSAHSHSFFRTRFGSCFSGTTSTAGPPASVRVELLEARRSRQDWQFLMGNHEDMLLETWRTVFVPWSFQPWRRRVPSTRRRAERSHRLLALASSVLRVGRVHFPSTVESRRTVPSRLSFSPSGRSGAYDVSPEWRGKKLVRGHRIVPAPAEYANYISLDTGCFKGDFLSLGILDDRRGAMRGWVQISDDGKATRRRE